MTFPSRFILLALLFSFAACGGEPATDEGGGGGAGEGATTGGEGQASTTGPMTPRRVSGRNFSVPVPEGYANVVSGTIADMMRDDVLTPGGLILMASESEVSGVAPGSVVVSPTATDISSDAVDEALCGQLANLVAGQQQATVERSGMVTLPWGQTCQWALRVGDDDNRLRLGTVFAAHAEDWIVTCNYDERDEAATAACNQVLGGWAFAE